MAADRPRRPAPSGREAPSVPAYVSLRPIANPLPLTLIGLAVASLLASGLELGWVASDDRGEVGIAILAFAVPLQSLAAVFGLLGRDPAGGTGAGVLAATWLATGVVLVATPAGTTSAALGLLLLGAAAALLVPAAAAALGKLVIAATLLLAAVRFGLTGVYELSASAAWGDASGIMGLVVCPLALYAAFAAELEDARGDAPLPLLRRGRGRVAVEGDAREQLAGLEHEAGVRNQL